MSTSNTKVTDEQVEQLIQYLQGTCMNSVDSAMNELFELSESDLSEEQLSHIDKEIFNCDTCGWWCESSENAGEDENICQDCKGDEDEDEDED